MRMVIPHVALKNVDINYFLVVDCSLKVQAEGMLPITFMSMHNNIFSAYRYRLIIMTCYGVSSVKFEKQTSTSCTDSWHPQNKLCSLFICDSSVLFVYLRGDNEFI